MACRKKEQAHMIVCVQHTITNSRSKIKLMNVAEVLNLKSQVE